MKEAGQFLRDLFFLARLRSKTLVVFITLFLISSMIDLVGIGLIGGYVATITGSSAEFLPEFLSATAQPDALGHHWIWILGGALIGVFFVKAAFAILVNRTIFRFSANLMIYLRKKVMDSFQCQPYEQYLQRNTGHYIRATSAYVSQVEAATMRVLSIMSELIVMIGVLVLLSFSNVAIVMALALLIGAVFLFFDWIVRGKIQNASREVNRYNKKVSMTVTEGFRGFKEIRLLGREHFFLDNVEAYSRQLAKAEVLLKTINLVPRHLIEVVLICFVVMVTWAIVSLNQDISQYFPVIAMFAAAGMRIGPSAAVLTGGVSQLRQAAPAISDLAKDLRGNRGGPGPKSGASCSNQEVFESLKLSNISFRYPGTCEDVLRDISLQIRSGDCIGIMGSSGSGKTTLVDVLLGLLIPTAGAIYVNRKSLSRNPKTWAGMVAYLPQENFLIDDSIERNVTLSEMISDGEKDNVSRNLRDAQILEAVKKFPEGVHTRVGEGGGRLSGGQRQRISIARAFYFKRDVLIFDEATSALDNDTEREIIAEIQKLKGKSTLIVIAHRASTLKVCDRVYRLSNGHLSPHSGTI